MNDELRKDPVFAVLARKLKPVLREDCAPVAGKSTLNRLEHTPKRNGAKYHKIDCNGEDVDGLFVDPFLESLKRPPRQIVLDLDATDHPFARTLGGTLLPRLLRQLLLSAAVGISRPRLAAFKLRRSDSDASAGALAARKDHSACRLRLRARKVDALVGGERR